MRMGAFLAAVFLIAAAWVYHPAEATDLDTLIPVETLWVERDEAGIRVVGNDVKGIGGDWEAALEDLVKSTAGTVFLETVDRIVISETAMECLDALRRDERLRPSTQLYLLYGAAGETLESFTAAHQSSATVENEKPIPWILEKDGRYRFAGTERQTA